MIISVLTNEEGEVLGVVEGPMAREDSSRTPVALSDESAAGASLEAGLTAEPGQKLSQIEVPNDFTLVLSPSEIGRRVRDLGR